jgi:hypothetical protein
MIDQHKTATFKCALLKETKKNAPVRKRGPTQYENITKETLINQAFYHPERY